MVVRPGLDDVTAVSLYGLLDEKSDASVHRSLSELAPVFDDERYNWLLLLGGDLNVWTGRSVPGSAHLDRHQVVLERIKAYGLVDCLERMRPARTSRGLPVRLRRRLRTYVDQAGQALSEGVIHPGSLGSSVRWRPTLGCCLS